jgi:hypothetical protein
MSILRFECCDGAILRRRPVTRNWRNEGIRYTFMYGLEPELGTCSTG